MGDKTKIEWCDATWNPVSGCWNGCEYCYASKIANRFAGADGVDEEENEHLVHVLTSPLMKTDKSGVRSVAPYPFGFEPTFHKDKLKELESIKGETIFVCSMADLFGYWVPDSWIQEIFDVCENTPGHRYLFLTKNPKRLVELGREERLPIGDEFWYGSTITNPDTPAFWSRNHHTFISMEPILKPFDVECGCNSILEHAEWFILGAETGNRKDKVKPEPWWVESAVEKMLDHNIPVFMKDSMKSCWEGKLITQFPW